MAKKQKVWLERTVMLREGNVQSQLGSVAKDPKKILIFVGDTGKVKIYNSDVPIGEAVAMLQDKYEYLQPGYSEPHGALVFTCR